MNKKIITSITIFAILMIAGVSVTFAAPKPSVRYSGYLLADPINKDRVWYVSPVNQKRYDLGVNPDEALSAIKKVMLGITEANLKKIPKSNEMISGDKNLRKRLSGRFLLAVEDAGNIWYVRPTDLKRYYFIKTNMSFAHLRSLAVSVTVANLKTIAIAYTQPETPAPTSQLPIMPTTPTSYGCAYSNPSCDWWYNCINNKCVLKSGCAYNNPACSTNQICQNNLCILKAGCQYNNPSCPSGQKCNTTLNQCETSQPATTTIQQPVITPPGCAYNNPSCSSGQKCNTNLNQCEINSSTTTLQNGSACADGDCEIPNVAIIEIPENDPLRNQSNGIINMDTVIQKFYKTYSDDFDVLLTFDIGTYNGKYNGWSDGGMRRYVPSNIGYIDECSSLINPTCKDYPARLRYMQQFGMRDRPNVATNANLEMNKNTFIHELGHYWTIGWGTFGKPQCYDSWAQYVYNFSEGHWSGNFEAGEASIMLQGSVLLGKNGTLLDPNLGKLVDNKDGTFTSIDTKINDPMFNYMDLYAMGLITGNELATKDIFAIYNLEKKYSNPIAAGYNYSMPEWHTYYGTRKDITLADFKKMLLDKEACEGKDYYTGDGSRVLNAYDKGREPAKDLRVALVLIKFPEQKIFNKKAREICQALNYDFPKAWNEATYGLSTMRTNLSEATKNPDCNAL